jgi:AraC-like DNA-binding protein
LRLHHLAAESVAELLGQDTSPVARGDPDNTSRYWLDGQVRGLSLLSADFTTHEFATHTHEALLVAVTEEGGSEVAAPGVSDEAHSAALLVVGPAEPHSSRMRRSGHWRYRSFYLMESALEEVAGSLDLARFPSLGSALLRQPDLIHAFLRLHRSLESGADELLGRELLVSAFGGLVARHAAARRTLALPAADRVLLDRVTGILRERHAERVTLPELAAPAGMTQLQLIGLFRAGTGLTPHAYLTQVRLGAACRLLRGGATIAAAALEAGFYDQSALNRHFKRCYGMTPLQYVRAVRR